MRRLSIRSLWVRVASDIAKGNVAPAKLSNETFWLSESLQAKGQFQMSAAPGPNLDPRIDGTLKELRVSLVKGVVGLFVTTGTLYGAGFLLAFALSTVPPAFPSSLTMLHLRAATLDDVSKARSMEKEENFDGALDLLERYFSRLDGSQQTAQKELGQHLAHLRAFVAIRVSIKDDTLLASDRSKALGQLLSQFDPTNDVYLLNAGRKQLDCLNVKALSFRGRYGHFRSRVADSLKKKDLWSLPVSTAWVLVVPALFLLALIYFLWRFWPRSGFLISFEDLTAELSSKAHKDRILTQEMQEACWVPRAEHTFGGLDLRVFAINDHDGSSFATLIPQKTLVVWADIIQATSPIKVGPIEFNVVQLVALLLGWLQSPTRHALVGSLHEREGQTVITAQRLNRTRHLVAGFSWKVQSESGPQAQHDLIGDLAAQMLVDLRGTVLTPNWRSYRSLLQGIAALDRRPPARDSCNCFGTARQHLWRALQEDPGNWMARFYLAIALRRCGNNEEAARHFAEVAQLFATAEKRLALRPRLHVWRSSKSFLERHLWKYPQCALIVLYNRAMALSKLHDDDDMRLALSLLSHIVDLCKGGNLRSEASIQDRDIPDADAFTHSVRRLTEEDRRRFACVARSAQTVVWAAQAEYLCPETVDSLPELRSKIVEIEKGLSDSAAREGPVGGGGRQDDSASLDLALATVLCAKGKVQTLLGLADQARESFYRAVLVAPNLVDAQLSLAASYVNYPGDGSAWTRAAEEALQNALAFDPDCPKAYYWLARLSCSRKPPNYDQALQELEKTESLPEGFLLRAEVYARADFSGRDLETSIKAWREGLEGLPRILSPDQFHHLENLRSVAENHASNDELQNTAAQAARHIAQNCPWQSRRWGSRAGADRGSAAIAS